jgi:hypothetical protein
MATIHGVSPKTSLQELNDEEVSFLWDEALRNQTVEYCQTLMNGTMVPQTESEFAHVQLREEMRRRNLLTVKA